MRFPAGKATEFSKDVDRFIEELEVSIPAIVESDEYKASLSIVMEKFKQKREEYVNTNQAKIL
jgi:hypothetical protein